MHFTLVVVVHDGGQLSLHKSMGKRWGSRGRSGTAPWNRVVDGSLPRCGPRLRETGREGVSLSGGNRNCADVTRDGEMGRKVFGPNAELLSGHTRTVIGRISENTEYTGCEEACNRHCHPGESLHEKVDRVLTVKFKR